MDRPSQLRGIHQGILLALVISMAGLAGPARAQYFGQNKVQYDDFDWEVIVTDNFNVYYYKAEEEAARDAARMAERAYAKLSKILDHDIKQKVPLLLYSSHTDFQQTNALSGLIPEGTGGVTEFLKRRVILPFTGSYAELDHVLTHELVHAFQVDILLGSDRSPLSAGMAAGPPLWFVEGMAEYLSISDVDEHTQMWLRDAALEGYLIGLGELSYTGDIRNYRFGQSILAFIDDHYGIQKIGEILKGSARRGGFDRAVQSALGIRLEDLSKRWNEEIRKTYLPQIAEFEKAETYGYKLTDHERDLSHLNLAPAVSPDGDLMVFLSDRGLYNDLYLASAIDGRIEKKLVEGERSSSFESLRFLQTSLAWSPDQRSIAFAAKVGGEDAIYIFDIDRRKVETQLTFGFDGILTPSFSPDGSQIVFVALDGGRSDLFITSRDGKELKRLTQDRFADRDPHWSPDGRSIAFTTDRGPRTNFRTLEFGDFKIAVYDLETDQIRVLPGQYGKNISPQWSPDGTKIAFVSDRTGVSNIFMMDAVTGESFQLTNVLTGVSGIIPASPPISWSQDGHRLLLTVFERGGFNIYAIKDPLDLLDEQESSQPEYIAADTGAREAPRRLGSGMFGGMGEVEEIGPESFVGEDQDWDRQVTAEGDESPAEDESVADGEASTEGEASAEGEAGAEGANAEEASEERELLAGSEEAEAPASAEEGTLPASAEDQPVLVANEPEPPDETADDMREPTPIAGSTAEAGDDPEDEEAEEEEEEEAVPVTYRPPAPDGESFTVRDYKISFSPDVLAGGGGFAPGLGVAGQLALGFSDVLGNHRLVFAANVFGDLTQSDLYFAYLNLERRNNWGVAVFQYRNDYLSFRDNAILRYDSEVFRGAEVFLSRPFSRFRRGEISLQVVGVDRGDAFADDELRSGTGVENIDKKRLFFLKPQVAFVTDNVLFGSTGPISGARTRTSIAQSIGDLDFTTITLDARKYINIRQRYAFAFRFLGVTSFGSTPQSFYIGGPYSLRGWGFEEFQGHNAGVINAEFRFPLVDQFRLGWPLPLDFRGIRGVFFFDAGSAFDRHDSFKAFDGSGAGFIRLQDVAASYGFGARINLGFLILRWDLSQKTDLSRNIGKAISTLAIGGEF